MIVEIRSIFREDANGHIINNPGAERARYPVRIDPDSVQLVEQRGLYVDFRFVVGFIAEGAFAGRAVELMTEVTTGGDRTEWRDAAAGSQWGLVHTEVCGGRRESHFVPIC